MPNTPQHNNNPAMVGGVSPANTRAADLARLAQEYAEEIQAELLARLREQELLRRSESRYRDFFENAKDAIYVHDLSGRYLMVNRAGEELIGYSKEDLLQMTVFDVVPFPHLAQVGERLKQKLAEHATTIYEVEVLRKDGSQIWVEVNSRLIYENGAPVGVEGIVRDISERKRAERALSESEERFRNLFENSRDPLFTCDLEGNFTSINQAGETLTGFSRREILESNFTNVVAPEYLGVANEMLSRKALGDVATIYELEIITKQNERIFVEVSSRTLHAADNPIGVQGSVRDITSRKRDENSLRKSEWEYRMLFDRNPQPMWVCDQQTRGFLAVNDAAVCRYGYSREAFLEMRIDALHPADEVPALIERLTQLEGHSRLGEWRHRVWGGHTINVEMTANSIDFANRKATLVLVNDITAQKMAEQALHENQVQLQQVVRLEAMGQLAGGFLHEFNNLLTAISGYSDLTLRRLSDDDPLRRNVLAIKKATDRATYLTRQLFTFAPSLRT